MRTLALELALTLLASLGPACGDTDPKGDIGCWRSENTGPSPAPPLFLLDRELRVLDQGVTEWAEVPLGGAAAVALQVMVPPGHTACVQLDTVEDTAGHPWVSPSSSGADLGEYCRGCPQRVSVASQTGFYVLPSRAPLPAAPAGDLLVRATLRECETLLPGDPGAPGAPRTLRLQALPIPLPPVDREGVIRLALILTPGSIFFDTEAPQAPLQEALRLVNQALRPAKLRVEVTRSRRLSAEYIDPLSFTPGDGRELRHVLDLLRHCPNGTSPPLANEVPVVLAGCLVAHDPITGQTRRPLGRVTHIPGGLATQEGADGIFLAGRHCDPQGAQLPWSSTTLARLLAHELGHFLGLYHTVEADGTRDQLDDTHADNAMYFDPLAASAQGFSPGQMQVIRRHPVISYD